MHNNHRPTQVVDLPFSQDGDLATEQASDGNDKSIPESFVILQSLKQSRDVWLSSTFPKFSSKARGKAAGFPAPPPHTIQNRGKCDLEIGPHIFPDTTFYEVHYLHPQSQVASIPRYAPTTSQWQSAPGPHIPYAQSQPSQPAQAAQEASMSTTPLISSIASTSLITPTLISQVNLAASTNPILANLLQLAAAGGATPEQLKTLGLLIQSLASPEPPLVIIHIFSFVQCSHGVVTTLKPFDLVLEFNVTPLERWLFPRGPVVCERLGEPSSVDHDVILKALFPLDKPTTSGIVHENNMTVAQENTPQPAREVVTLCLKNPPAAVWDTLTRWKPADRVYLKYRLPEGPMLTQLQTIATAGYSMRPLKPGQPANTRAKRRQRKPAPDAGGGAEPPPTKRRRVPQSGATTVAQIRCVVCQQTDVPLILSGQFCRPCVDSGRAKPEIPQLYANLPRTPTEPAPDGGMPDSDVAVLSAQATAPMYLFETMIPPARPTKPR
ncbi:hypothetical protein BD779DRAFT_1666734 [Infundibulicybe gibba]|nr:hypothetical protein BD779DRAFT_1666734 [Infundibulicybe gibba]